MTKKDYELFANEVRFLGSDSISKEELVGFLGGVFSQDNELFNFDKFKEACLTGKHIRKTIKGGR